jgi:hypothetical protein
MAEETAAPARPRPAAKKKTPAPAAKKASAKAAPKVSKYHVYQESDKGVLTPVSEVEARNAEHAVSSFIDAPGDFADLAAKVTAGTAGLTVVPERNLSRVKAEVETKTRVKLSVA